MEYFDWLSVPQAIISYFGAYLGGDVSTAEHSAAFVFKWNLICVIAAAGLYLLGLIMGGVGLYAMAKRRGAQHGWLGFLPFGNTWLSGEFAEQGNLMGKQIKKIGLWCVIAEVVFVALETFTLVSSLILISNPAFYSPQEIVETGEVFYTFDSALVSEDLRALSVASDVISIISTVWWFILLVLFCALYSSFFRKYYARSPYLMTFLCSVVPCRGFVLFAVRNNTPLDYNEYIRKRMAEERRRYDEQFGRGGDNGSDGNSGNGNIGGNGGSGGSGGKKGDDGGSADGSVKNGKSGTVGADGVFCGDVEIKIENGKGVEFEI